jgi:hypothetical protein
MMRSLILICLGLVAVAAEAVLPAPPAAVVDAAIASPLVGFDRRLKGGAHTWQSGTCASVVVLALAAATGDGRATVRLLEQIRHSLDGEHCLSANGGYPAQHERSLTTAYTILRHSPRLWQLLAEPERQRVELAMTAAMVASAYTTGDAAYAGGGRVTALDGDDNLNRGWNPNYREGMIGMLPVAAAFFGPAEAQRLLDTYDHRAFVAQLAAAGLENTHETFTWKAEHPDSAAPEPARIEQVVRGWRYQGLDCRDAMALYLGLTRHSFGARVHPGLRDGTGIAGAGCLLAGIDDLPNRGAVGMLLEFDSGDAGGKRSSAAYAYTGLRPNLFNQIALICSGLWRSTPESRAGLALIEIGATDLAYKLEHGYRDYHKGRPRGVQRIGDPAKDYRLTFALWRDVLLPWHQNPVPAGAAGAAAAEPRAAGPSRAPLCQSDPAARRRYLALLRTRIGESVDAGQRPRFSFRLVGQEVEVQALVGDQVRLRVPGLQSEMTVDLWDVVSAEEARTLATEVLRRDHPGDHALAAFWQLAAGDRQEGEWLLRQAGAEAAAVRAAFPGLAKTLPQD